MDPTENAPSVLNGKLCSPRVTDRSNGKIEKGPLAAVHAIVVHQTGGSTSESAFSSYEQGAAGAHFLLDKDGKIYQTARIDQKCWHIGSVRSRCDALKTCQAEDQKQIQAILFKKGEAYAFRVKKLHDHESAKSYPDRYPTNEDSIGIEIVGGFDIKAKKYETVNAQQNESLVWLVRALVSHLRITYGDVYRHPEVSYKEATEGATAAWTP